ncbi:hypothetical protein ACTXGQ_04425 [Marinobacter sp. 1Y8]
MNQVKERPILFNGEMVRAILEGRKTQTRRTLKEQPPEGCSAIEHPRIFAPLVIRRGEEQPGPDIFGVFTEDGEWSLKSPYGQPGDRLWVRETWRQFNAVDECGCSETPCPCPKTGCVLYRADGDDSESRWLPSIHMPRWASRITLEITDVRVERLKDITRAGAKAEGVERHEDAWTDYLHRTEFHTAGDARSSFCTLWESINGKGSWSENPWVWVIEFSRIDQKAKAS